MAAPGASIPMQGSRRSETHQQRLLEVQAQILAQNHPIIGSARGAKPAGILNEGNTCFFNSTFQALAATTSLIDLVGPVIFPAPKNVSTTIPEGDEHQSGGGPPDALDRPAHTYTAIATGSDGYPLYPHSIPSLLDAALEPEHAKLLPVTLAFEKCLGKAWKAKDEGLKNLRAVEAGDTDAERAVEKEKSLSLRTLLKELSRKYDQYDDYRQQDAHELLRHLLDSMSMEEKDVIKALSPPKTAPGSSSTNRRIRRRSAVTMGPDGEAQIDGENVKDRLIPFSDALFGGSLVSVVICEGCKSVSHTYEGFMDISLSMKNQQPRVRKRDKFKAVASKFKLGSSSKPPSQTTNITAPVYLEGVHPPPATDHDSMTEEDHVKPLTKNGRQESVISMAVSMTSGSEAPSTHAGGFLGGRSKRDSSSTNVSGLKKRSSLSSWTTKKKSSRPSTASSIDSTELPEFRSFGASQSNMATSMPVKSSGIGNVYPFSGFRSNETTPTSSRRNSQVGLTLDSSLVSEAMENNPSVPEGREEEDNRYTPAKPRPEQAAYIRRLLNGPNLPQRPMDDPLERLRNGMAAMQVQGGAGDPNAVPEVGVGMAQPTIEGLDTDLMDSMKTFTAVEVLEGDNAFACHKCWRYKTGRGGQKKKRAGAATIREDEEDSSDSESDAPAEAPKRPAVAFTKTDTNIPEIAVTTDDEPQVDENAVADEEIDPTRNASNSLTANRTPRKSVTSSVETGRTSSSASGMSGYQTSSEDSSDDAPVGRLSVVRPPPPQRRKSQHFVLQRAFKRYMIARAPPVLVFHFKRFQQSNKHAATQMYSNGFATLKKIDDFVSFPEKIDLSPFLAPERTDYKVQIGPDGIGRANYESHPPGDKGPDLVPMRYKLYAVVVHLGATAITGHYVCYVLIDPGMIIKTRPSLSSAPIQTESEACEPDMHAEAMAAPVDKAEVSGNTVDQRVWCYCSDTQVRLASLEEVLKAKAYMCFYEKSS